MRAILNKIRFLPLCVMHEFSVISLGCVTPVMAQCSSPEQGSLFVAISDWRVSLQK